MRVYEYAKANDLTNEEVKKRFNLDHHMDLVPDDADLQEWDEPVEEEVIEEKEVKVSLPVADKNPKKTAELEAEAKKLRTYLGDNSIEYARFVSCYRDYLPYEYKLAKTLIDEVL